MMALREDFDELSLTATSVYDLGHRDQVNLELYRVWGFHRSRWEPPESKEDYDPIEIPLSRLTQVQAQRLYQRLPIDPDTQGATLLTVWRARLVEIEVGFMLIHDPEWDFAHPGPRPWWLEGVSLQGRAASKPPRSIWDRLNDKDVF